MSVRLFANSIVLC